MIRIKEILVKDNNVRQQMLDTFKLTEDSDCIYKDTLDGGIAFKIRFGAEYRWAEEFRNIQKGQFPGVEVFRHSLGKFNTLYFNKDFNINDLNRVVSEGGEMTLGDLVTDLIKR